MAADMAKLLSLLPWRITPHRDRTSPHESAIPRSGIKLLIYKKKSGAQGRNRTTDTMIFSQDA